MANVLRVLVANADARVRSALRLVLEQSPELHVAGEVASAREVVDQLGRLQPAVLFLDWRQSGLDRDAALTPLRAASPDLAVVALGAAEDRAAALAAGADYFLAKSDPPDVVLACLVWLAARRNQHGTSAA